MTEFSDIEIADVIIIGAGPAGLSAGLYCARAGLKTVIFGDPYSSQLARAGTVENFLTWTKPTTGIQIIEKMLEHATEWGAILVEKMIKQVVRDEKNLFHVYDSEGVDTCAYAVIIASGTKHKKLGVKGEEEYYAKGVGYCTICDGPLYKGEPIAIVGFGDEAAQAALRMATIASEVHLLVNKPRLGSDPQLLKEIENTENLFLYEGIKPLEIIGDNEAVTGIRFSQNKVEKQIDVKAVFVEVGVLPSAALASDLGIELTGQFIKVNRDQSTNIPGVFAAGDITGGIARQAIISAGDGARAAITAIDYIKKLGISTTKLKTTQWGSSKVTEMKTVSITPESKEKNPLYTYVHADEGFAAGYKRYKPKTNIITQIRELLPTAELVVVSAHWCPDCRRNVPKMAKIIEHLPNWKVRVHDRDEEGIKEKYGIRKIPTFIIRDVSGKELGRIIENPISLSLEEDLLNIIQNTAQK